MKRCIEILRLTLDPRIASCDLPLNPRKKDKKKATKMLGGVVLILESLTPKIRRNFNSAKKI